MAEIPSLDPWQRHTLDSLATYLDAASAVGAWAVVTTTGPKLRADIFSALAKRLPDAMFEWIAHDIGAPSPLGVKQALARALEQPITPRIRIVDGLDATLQSPEPRVVLSWLNFQREALQRPGEAFVFALDEGNLSQWTALAPDLNRYTLHFRFSRWPDLLGRADAWSRQLAQVEFNDAQQLEDSKHWAKEAKALGDLSALALAQAAVAHFAYRLGEWSEVDAILGDATTCDPRDEPYALLRLRAIRQVLRGQPSLAVQQLQDVGSNWWRSGIADLSFAHAHNGDIHRAIELARSLTPATDPDNRGAELANQTRWMRQLGQLRAVTKAIPELDNSRQASALHTVQSLVASDSGRLRIALKAARAARRTAAGRTDLLLNAHWAQAQAAYLLGALDDARANCLTLQALPHAKLGTCWEPQWLLADLLHTQGGPSAVASLVQTEQRRQDGWHAPKPAALLLYAQSLATADEQVARDYLEFSSRKLRAMDLSLYLGEVERELARLDRLAGDTNRARTRVEEGLVWHLREGAIWRECLDRCELALVDVIDKKVDRAREHAGRALELAREFDLRVCEPTALTALATVEYARGRHDTASTYRSRARRLTEYMHAQGLADRLARDWSSLTDN